MIYVCSEFKGLRIVINPMTVEIDKFGRKVKKPGRYAKFENGKFVTQDPEIIEFMEQYIKEWPSDGITKIDEKVLEKQDKIRKRVAEEMEKEEAVEKATKKASKSKDEKVSGKDFE